MKNYLYIFPIFLIVNFSQEENLYNFNISKIISEPQSFTIDNENNYYVLDKIQNRLIKFDKNGKLVNEIGGYGWGQLEFDIPMSITTFDGLNIFVSDCYNNRIQRFNKNLEYISTLKTTDLIDNEQGFSYPTIISVDRFLNLFVYDNENKRMVKFDNRNKVVKVFGGFNEYEGRIKEPNKIEIGPDDEVFVLDNEGIKIYNNWGKYIKNVFNNDDNIISFSVDKKSIYVLMEGQVITIDKDGEVVATKCLEKLISLEAEQKVIDLSVKNNRIHFLTSEKIISIPVY